MKINKKILIYVYLFISFKFSSIFFLLFAHNSQKIKAKVTLKILRFSRSFRFGKACIYFQFLRKYYSNNILQNNKLLYMLNMRFSL